MESTARACHSTTTYIHSQEVLDIIQTATSIGLEEDMADLAFSSVDDDGNDSSFQFSFEELDNTMTLSKVTLNILETIKMEWTHLKKCV